MRLRENTDLAMLTGVYGTFRNNFPIDTSLAYALKDKEMSGLLFLTMGGRGKSYTDTKDKPFTEHLPEGAREQYEKLRLRKFFDRFVLFKGEDEGIVVAVGVDELYYVLTSWDQDGISAWVPQFTDDGTMLLRSCIGN